MNKSIITIYSSVSILRKHPKKDLPAEVCKGVVTLLTDSGAFVNHTGKTITSRGEWFPYDSNELLMVKV